MELYRRAGQSSFMKLIEKSSCFLAHRFSRGKPARLQQLLCVVEYLFQLTINGFGNFTFFNAYKFQFIEIHIQ